VKEEQLQQGI